MAEAIARQLAQEPRFAGRFGFDSAGTGSWHVGEVADSRTLRTLEKRGVAAPSRARQVQRQDFAEFDVLVAMDEGHLHQLLSWPGSQPAKVVKMLNYLDGGDVPDPYYGTQRDFDNLYEMLESAISAMLEDLS